MRVCYRGWTAALLAALLAASAAHPCTTFVLENGGAPVFGRNYDWSVESAALFVNKRGVRKTAVLLNPTSTPPAEWTSKYGSVTFNQIAREFPCGGMNEAGLVVEVMVTDQPAHSDPGGRPAVGNLQWIQQQLDCHATVAEVIAHAQDAAIFNEVGTDLRYLLADASGDAAAVEVVDGKTVCHHGAGLPHKVLANNGYREHLEDLGGYSLFGGHDALPGGEGSKARFVRAADGVAKYRPGDAAHAVAGAFRILDDVAQDNTQWRIVYDIPSRRIHYRTLSRADIRTVDAKAFDYACASPVQMLDVNAPAKGDVTGAFTDYTPKANQQLVLAAFDGVKFLRPYKRVASLLLPLYPEMYTTCADAEPAGR